MSKFYNKLLLAVCTVLVVLIAKQGLAATIDATDCTGQKQCTIFWEQINNDDAAGPERWRGGSGVLYVTGTQSTAVMELEWGPTSSALTDVYTADAPTGTEYNSTTGLEVLTCVTLPPGYVEMDLSTAGDGTQDIDVYLIPVDKCE